jgi:hypothetical protein
MCGRLVDELGDINPDSEYNQLIKEELIIPEQFYGVEKIVEFHEGNIKAHPHLNLINGDFFNVMLKYASEKNFNPGIINADVVFMHKKAASYFCDIIELLKQVGANNVMVVLNYMRNNPRKWKKEYDANALIEEIISNRKWHYASEGLEWSEEVYDYNGDGDGSKTKMCTFLFWRR